MRVLMVARQRSHNPGGMSPSLLAHVDAVRSLGIAVEEHIVRAHRIPATLVAQIPAVKAAVRKFRPDVVHAHSGTMGWTARWQPRPLVVSFVGDDLVGRSRIANQMSRSAARRADAIVCETAALAAALEREMDRHRAAVIARGVNTSAFHPGDRAASRLRLGLPPRTRLILFPHQGPGPDREFHLAEAAVAELRRSMPDAAMLHVSGVPHAEMPEYYRAADCLLVTRTGAGSSSVLKEGLASGLPVVGVDAGDVRSWLDRVHGCEVVAPEAQAIAAALARVLGRDTRPDPAPVLSDLDRTATARLLVAVYESVRSRRS